MLGPGYGYTRAWICYARHGMTRLDTGTARLDTGTARQEPVQPVSGQKQQIDKCTVYLGTRVPVHELDMERVGAGTYQGW